jgi:hypothetical protein
MDFTDDEIKKLLKRRRTLSRRRYFYFKWLESLISHVPVRPTDATLPAAGNVAGRSRGGCDQSIYGHKTMPERDDENTAQLDQLRSSNGFRLSDDRELKTGAEATPDMDDDHAEEARHKV